MNKRLQVAYTHALAFVWFILNESRTPFRPPPPQRILRDTHYTINITQEHAVTGNLYSL